jgi:branched-chain amino acid transport system permease protein
MAEMVFVFLRDLTIFFAIYTIVSLSLNLEHGYTGIPNFGKVLAVAGGAFVVGFFPGRLVAWIYNIGSSEYSGLLDYASLGHHVTIVNEVNKILASNAALSITVFVVTLLVAGLVGAGLGYLASFPAIKLREDYLAIMLLAMGEAIRVIGHNYTPIIRGNIGALVPDVFGWAGELRYLAVLFFVVGVCILVFFYLQRLVKTPLGRTLRATRDNEDVARTLGKNVISIRMKVLVIAAMIGAIAGALDAFKAGGVISTMYHRETWTFWPWVMVVLGGAGNNLGVVSGVLVFTILRRGLDFFKGYLDPLVPFSVVWIEPMVLGVMLILILMYRPEGMIPEKPISTLKETTLGKLKQSLRRFFKNLKTFRS